MCDDNLRVHLNLCDIVGIIGQLRTERETQKNMYIIYIKISFPEVPKKILVV